MISALYQNVHIFK